MYSTFRFGADFNRLCGLFVDEQVARLIASFWVNLGKPAPERYRGSHSVF